MTSQIPTPTLLLTSLPPKTLIGIDLLSFTTTPNFHGIKNLPPGPHFLYTGATESFSLRSGEWFFIHDSRTTGSSGGAATGEIDIRLRRWDAGTEALVPIDEGTEEGRREAMRLRANLGRIWAGGGLLAYDRARGEQQQRQRQRDNNGTMGAELTLHNHHQQQTQQEEPEPEPESTQEPTSDWPQLTNYISSAVLSRILGSNPNVTSTAIITRNQNTTRPPLPRWTVSSGSSAVRDRDDIPGLSAAEVSKAYDTGTASEQEKELRFLPVDLKRTWRDGAVGRERTEAAQDRSWALGDLVGRFGKEVGLATPTPAAEGSKSTTTAASDDDDDDEEEQGAGEAQILGELQFTFLMVLTLMNFSCLEQWKRLLGLVLTCRAAVRKREKFFVRVLHLLRLQLRHFDDVEGGLFEMDGDDGGALLRRLLTRFSRTVQQDFAEGEKGGGQMVRKELGLLEDWVKGEYGWELRPGATVTRGMLELEDGEQVEVEVSGANEEDEMGEYAPVIVDLGEGDSLGKGLVEEAEEDEEAGESVSDVDMSEINPR
ncbi:hypothetical protein GX50_03863 [[Emmonsia] crescens]|uniref:A1 cistron-splicing factor AAR2 n=1 Tax=[Emmonsia] crescens TaxID=73230 RepID=A0A2B7ZJ10_9EURO|nr:hypothetical protein GX50_03863 [Emmonsia crescens]